ncbi:putative HTH-type transcriptional regulator YsmB [Alicyclobacillus cellulosilyticus]|uniref:HTH-type transcriptional regulator YsmB n=1 Tax=Alicyclobacillus cellulosilyticus TaxID=1003997 RepID=A0A917K0Z1_9BACL|nr:MarR family transcriptional regulator [Alicyclobacillus cellulosilyticus]GGI96408.1 putative HTH-type transcriptional regulator YsmB [Alicyclobacillus cellulosilyticus]
MSERFPEYVIQIEQRLRQIAAIVRRKGRQLLDSYGITPPQFDALLILNREGTLTIGDLSNRLYLAYSTTTDLVDRLERAQLVARQRDHQDRRVVRVQLLPAGAELIERVLDARRAYLQRTLQHLEPEEHAQVLRVLDILYTHMEN